MDIRIRETNETDLPALQDVIEQTFGTDQGPEIFELVADLLADPTATPLVSLLACTGEKAVGHVLFTNARIEGSGDPPRSSILAPLAVIPESQSEGIGGRLIREGLEAVSGLGVELVFVLGHPGYYPRHGFKPAGVQGFEAPYPIPPEHADAWMVQELRADAIARAEGKVRCADALDEPQHWRE